MNATWFTGDDDRDTLTQPVCDRCGESNVQQPGDWCAYCVSADEPSEETLRQELQGFLEDQWEKGAPR